MTTVSDIKQALVDRRLAVARAQRKAELAGASPLTPDEDKAFDISESIAWGIITYLDATSIPYNIGQKRDGARGMGFAVEIKPDSHEKSCLLPMSIQKRSIVSAGTTIAGWRITYGLTSVLDLPLEPTQSDIESACVELAAAMVPVAKGEWPATTKLADEIGFAHRTGSWLPSCCKDAGRADISKGEVFPVCPNCMAQPTWTWNGGPPDPPIPNQVARPA